jgi:hypothetical protein
LLHRKILCYLRKGKRRETFLELSLIDRFQPRLLADRNYASQFSLWERGWG